MVSIDWIMDYAAGELDEQAIVDGFQQMIDDGSVWKLRGSYGRMAAAYIEAGLCHKREENNGSNDSDSNRVR